MGLVMSIADHVVALNFGRKLAEGTPAQVQSDPDVVANALDQVAKHMDLFVVEAAGGLVEQQDLRIGGERAGQFDALLGAERQAGNRDMGDCLLYTSDAADE